MTKNRRIKEMGKKILGKGRKRVEVQKGYRVERMVLTVEITKEIIFSEGINLG